MFKKIGITKNGLELAGLEDVKSGKKTIEQYLNIDKETTKEELKILDDSVS